MEQKRILVYGMVGTNRGGIENYLLKMNSKMTDNTIFDYVVEEASCLHTDVINKRGGEVVYISSRRNKPLKNIIDNYRLLKRSKQKYCSVYFNLSSLSWIIPIAIARLFKYKVFVHSHNADFIPANSSRLHKLTNYISKRILSSFNIGRLTCSKLAGDFMFMPSDKVEMVYNAVDVNLFKYDEEVRNRKRSELSIPQDTFVIGFVGRLAHQKNPHYLVKIMKALPNLDKVLLLIVGDGPLRPEIEKEIDDQLREHITFLGNRTDVNELYQVMDVFILPSFHEGLPYVVVEAQTTGLECLVSEYVTREVNYTNNVKFLPIDSDINIWSEEIEKTRNNPLNRVEMFKVMEASPFNIYREARRLESLLTEN